MRKITFLAIAYFLVFLPVVALAKTGSLGDSADSLLNMTAMVTKLMHIACYIIGVALILGSVAQYKNHRQNPKLVPLGTPITLLILGVIAVLIPYGSKMFGESYSAEDKAKVGQKETVLPLPGSAPKSSGLIPLPGSSSNEQQQYNQPTPDSHQDTHQDAQQNQDANQGYSDEPSSGGGWTTDPRYNQ